MKAYTISMMFAAAIAMAAPSMADARPNSRTRHINPRAKTTGHGYKQSRKIRKKIAQLKKQQRNLEARNLRLKRYVQKMHRRGLNRRAVQARRTMRANRTQVQVLQRKINRLMRSLAPTPRRVRYKASVKKHRRGHSR